MCGTHDLIGDYVYCTNCHTEQIVSKGGETCINCNKKGSLQWATEVKRCQTYGSKEVEENPMIIQKHIRDCKICGKKVIFEKYEDDDLEEFRICSKCDEPICPDCLDTDSPPICKECSEE